MSPADRYLNRHFPEMAHRPRQAFGVTPPADAEVVATYRIASRSQEGMLYTVNIYDNSSVDCTCYAHRAEPGRLCFHKREAVQRFIRENPA